MDLGDRMKMLEGIEGGRLFLPLLPICVRLDGRCFSGYTRGLARPYDERFSRLMQETTRYLVVETNACVGYTQSDEISLVYYSDSYESQVFFGGRIQKIVSTLASMCTAFFNFKVPEFLPEKDPRSNPKMLLAGFDCRAWTVPDKMEAVNALLWRELDASKNSVSMAAREFYSHKELHEKNGSQMQEMLFQKGVNWNNYPDFFKRGTYFQRRWSFRKYTVEELEKLPPLHEARKDPDLQVQRSEVRKLILPPLAKVVNRVDVVFSGAEPEVEAEKT